MTRTELAKSLWLPLAVAILFAAAIGLRPLMPIDETRYLTVAWEMYVRAGWFDPLTLNFVPYHHKPPLLLWLINISWSIFGTSRWAATVPVVLMALASVYLTGILARLLFPAELGDRNRTNLIMVAGAPFLTYGTIIMFDVTLTVFVLLSLIGVVLYSRERQWRHVLLIGVALGLGGLTKGPFAPFCVFFPILLAPFWAKRLGNVWTWYAGNAVAGVIALVIVLAWLVPMLAQADGDFAYWLLWKQTVGRVTGDIDAHLAPFYAYLPLLPAMLVPWIFLPRFWKEGMKLRSQFATSEGMRFLICWLVPTFIGFCLFSNKQPHYLMPLVPGMVILSALCLRTVPTMKLARTTAIMVGLLVVGQAVASATFLHRYDLTDMARFIRDNPERDWAFVTNYHGEFGFLAELRKPIDEVQPDELGKWYRDHPNGYAIMIYREPNEVSTYLQVANNPYRSRNMGVFASGATEEKMSVASGDAPVSDVGVR